MYHFVPSHATTVVKYRRNVGRLSIDMSADKWTTTLGRHINQHIGRVSVDISTDTSVDTSTDIYRSTYRSTLDRYVDRHIGRVSTDMSTNISVESRSICRPIYRSRGAQNTHDPSKLTRNCFMLDHNLYDLPGVVPVFI